MRHKFFVVGPVRRNYQVPDHIRSVVPNTTPSILHSNFHCVLSYCRTSIITRGVWQDLIHQGLPVILCTAICLFSVPGDAWHSSNGGGCVLAGTCSSLKLKLFLRMIEGTNHAESARLDPEAKSMARPSCYVAAPGYRMPSVPHVSLSHQPHALSAHQDSRFEGKQSSSIKCHCL